MSKILYQILNVQPTATLEEIKKSYKKLALEFHPDKNSSEEAKESFQKLIEAYNILSDETKRGIYDRTGDIQ